MDELEQRREHRSNLDATRDGSPVVDLAARDREAQRQDQAAEEIDDVAKAADRTADQRDAAAEEREAMAETLDAAGALSGSIPFDVRRRAHKDRIEAGHDREQALEDRRRARRDRQVAKQGRSRAADDRGAAWEALAALRLMLSNAENSAEDMLLIGRAQGIIMQERGLAPTAALIELCAQATQNELALADASRNIVADSS